VWGNSKSRISIIHLKEKLKRNWRETSDISIQATFLKKVAGVDCLKNKESFDDI